MMVNGSAYWVEPLIIYSTLLIYQNTPNVFCFFDEVGIGRVGRRVGRGMGVVGRNEDVGWEIWGIFADGMKQIVTLQIYFR